MQDNSGYTPSLGRGAVPNNPQRPWTPTSPHLQEKKRKGRREKEGDKVEGKLHERDLINVPSKEKRKSITRLVSLYKAITLLGFPKKDRIEYLSFL